METINSKEAKTHFSKILEQVSHGEEVIIAKYGHPIAKIVPYVPESRKLGLLADGHYESDDCWDSDPEVIEAFEQSGIFPKPSE